MLPTKELERKSIGHFKCWIVFRIRKTMVMSAQQFPNITRYDKMPKGWKVLQGAMTAPKGYIWIWNGKSIFKKEYQHALLRTE